MNPEYPFQPQQPGPASPQASSDPYGAQPSGMPQPTPPPQQYTQPPLHDQPFAVPGTPVPPAPHPGGYTPLPPANPPRLQSRPSKKWLIMTFVFIFTTLAAGGLAGWAVVNYLDQKDNVDSKVKDAVALAQKETSDKDAANFLEKEKQPNRQFAGPDDYGRLSFDYPKTWSVYEASAAAQGSTYEAYFNPGVVPPVSNTQQYALHVTIENADYDKVLDNYQSLVSRGDLRSSGVTIYEQPATRLEGNFTDDIRGMAVIFKIRDKTVTIRSDAETFRGDFDALVKSITFNK